MLLTYGSGGIADWPEELIYYITGFLDLGY